jgi:hypothetical protein
LRPQEQTQSAIPPPVPNLLAQFTSPRSPLTGSLPLGQIHPSPTNDKQVVVCECLPNKNKPKVVPEKPTDRRSSKRSDGQLRKPKNEE